MLHGRHSEIARFGVMLALLAACFLMGGASRVDAMSLILLQPFAALCLVALLLLPGPFDSTTSNCSNNYGPYQFPEKLIPLFMINCLTGKNLPIYGDGMNVRDWLHVEDHCRGIELVLENGRVGETYNVGGGAELPNLAVIDAICAGVDAAFAADPDLARRFPDAPAARGEKSESLKTYVTDRKGHDRRYAIDERKIRGELGYAPARTFEEGFAATLAWYLANEGWWRAVMDGSYAAWIDQRYGVEGASAA